MKTLIACIAILVSSTAVASATLNEPFFYAQQTSLWTIIKVPKGRLLQQLGGSLNQMGFELASFEDPSVGYLILKPMVFSAEFGQQTESTPGVSFSTEVELTALVYPKNGKKNAPRTFHDFLTGNAQPGSLGQLRLDVLCDNEVAVAAGRAKYFEHKFTASFTYNYPPANSSPFSFDITSYVFKAAGVTESMIFHMKANLAGLSSVATKFGSSSYPEILYATNPPESSTGARQTPVIGNRVYTRPLKAFEATPSGFSLSLGQARGAQPLVPVPFPPFDNGGVAIAGSENWPAEVVARLGMISSGQVIAYLLYQPRPVEIENGPFEVGAVAK